MMQPLHGLRLIFLCDPSFIRTNKQTIPDTVNDIDTRFVVKARETLTLVRVDVTQGAFEAGGTPTVEPGESIDAR